jgi:hypothetical protein
MKGICLYLRGWNSYSSYVRLQNRVSMVFKGFVCMMAE